ncbi:ATPase inhibitor mai-1, mitochondrial-like isoform X1 [Neodiprion pinetum]|uniref:ATPase inhibitor mai-1, mitochondrial-like isoform X1 n=1 Tax=Neodiprion pinetum TaxID=441929 RepID=UPI001EDFBF12|nr:ATPase inhibitor mai-2, mitochondrial-like isoform X2 [Neodiprion pinetum]
MYIDKVRRWPEVVGAKPRLGILQVHVRMSGEPGSGAGKGGGGGGSIREAGGSFGKMEAAREDQYFYNQQKEQLKNLRDGLHDEISFHEEQIKRHQEAIERHKARIGKMEK